MLLQQKFTTMLKPTYLKRSNIPWIQFAFYATVLGLGAVISYGILLYSPVSLAQDVGFNNDNFFTEKVKGDVVMIGNTLLHCSPNNPGFDCPGGNNALPQRYVNSVPVSGQRIFNSSSANLTLPTGAKVIMARLYWGATLHRKDGDSNPDHLPECGNASASKVENNNCTLGSQLRDKVKIRYGNMQNYVDVTGRFIGPAGGGKESYHSFADVTARLQDLSFDAAVPLTFTVANVQTARGIQRHAGWNLVVVYQEPASSVTPLRSISVYQGYRRFLGERNKPFTGQITLPGIETPKEGPVNVLLWTFAYEGDRAIRRDSVKINGRAIGDQGDKDNPNPEKRRPNYLQSIIENPMPPRNSVPPFITAQPQFNNNVGIDIQRHRAPAGSIRPGSTSIEIEVSTEEDGLTFGAFAIRSDLVATVDLAISKTNNVTTVKPGEQVTYIIEAKNNSEQAVADASVTDGLPPSLLDATWKCAASNGSNCDQPEGSGSINTTVDLAPDGSARFTVTGRLARDASGELVNKACIDVPAGTIETNRRDNCAIDSDPIPTVADLAITKTDGRREAKRGEEITYTIEAINNGPSSVVGARVIDIIPVSLVGPVWTCTGAGGASCSPASGKEDLGADVNLPAGGKLTFIVKARIAAGTPDCEINNTAFIEGPPGLIDSNPGNNSATDTTALPPMVDLSIVKKADPRTYIAGCDQIVYDIIATNNSSCAVAENVEIQDTLPPHTTFVSAMPSAGGQCPSPAAGGPLICSWSGPTAAKADRSAKVIVKINSSAPVGVIENEATVKSDTPELNPDNNKTKASVPVATRADLSLRLTDAPDPVKAGGRVTYTIVATNSPECSDAQNVRISNVLPVNASFVSATATGGTCEAPEPGQSGTISCRWIGATPAGTQREVIIVAEVAACAANESSLSDSASVSSDTPDPDPSNNSKTEVTRVQREADLAIKKFGPSDPVKAGTALTYRAEATNEGPSCAQDLSIADDLPENLSFLEIKASEGGECRTPRVGERGSVSCVWKGETESQKKRSLELKVKVAATTPDETILVNTARVSSPTPDPNLKNNEASVETRVIVRADLAITKVVKAEDGRSDRVIAGRFLVYTITITNSPDSSPAQNVGIIDFLPKDDNSFTRMTFDSWAPSTGGVCTRGDGQKRVICTWEGLTEPGASRHVTLKFRVANEPRNATACNEVSITTLTKDDNPANNYASVGIKVGNGPLRSCPSPNFVSQTKP